MRVLVALTLPEANQAVEALRNRADSMRHRVTLGKARIEDVAASILDCAMAEAAIREAFGFDPVPDDAAPRLADPGDHHVYVSAAR